MNEKSFLKKLQKSLQKRKNVPKKFSVFVNIVS